MLWLDLNGGKGHVIKILVSLRLTELGYLPRIILELQVWNANCAHLIYLSCLQRMGCICSKGSNADDYVAENEMEKEKEQNKSPVKMVAPLCREKVIGGVVNKPRTEGSLHSRSKTTSESNESSYKPGNVEENGKTRIIERPKNGHQRFSTPDMVDCGTQQTTSRSVSMPHGAKAEQVSAGWPSWLVSVAGEAIQGWIPRSAESYEKLNKIGQGTYSSVYKARDLTNDKIVAMKKVRFVKMDPESFVSWHGKFLFCGS